MNPYNSPWLKPTHIKFNDQKYKARYLAIKTYVTGNLNATEFHSNLVLNKDIYIAKNSMKFRLKSHLDWAYYTPKTLADAINNNTVEQYYEIMLNDINSDPNIWKDTDFEMTLKSFYANRIGRASLL